MAYTATNAIATFNRYLGIDENDKILIPNTNRRGFILRINENEDAVIFLYPLVHKQDDSKNYFDTRDSGAPERAVTWNYALEHKLKYFCLGVNDEVEKYKDYIFSLECTERKIGELSGTINGQRNGPGNQIIIPNPYIPSNPFERFQNKLGVFISAIHKNKIYDYLSTYDNRPYLIDPEPIDIIENTVSDQDSLSFTKKSLLEFSDADFARRYITSLLAKPFVILTGNSGTGKTRIAKQFSEYLEVTETVDGKERKNWLIVPVGADWTDNTKILGFYNPLAPGKTDGENGDYEGTEILDLIERANKNKTIPYFLILDEMNLSHVERYFSDFLSHMETPDVPFVLDGYKCNPLPFPENLFIVGTVNIDETTYMFSPKVLDRANVIEFKPEKEDVMKLFSSAVNTDKVQPAGQPTAEAFLRLAKEIRSGTYSLSEEDTTTIQAVFGKVFDYIEPKGFEFAYRTVREIRQYISAAYELNEQEQFPLFEAIDEQLLQKILPKIHGNRKEIGELLDNLEKFCTDDADEEKHLKLSAAKIKQMEEKLNTVQYASFI